jgi:hypothetical protein
MMHRKFYFFCLVAGLSLAIFSGLFSCRKGDPIGIIQSTEPPPPISKLRDFSISEFEDTLDLRFSFGSFSDIDLRRFDYAWTCEQTPAGAKPPVILNANKPEGTAYGLEPGIYRFRIVASNKKGQSTQSFQVTVMQDTLRGRTFIIPGQKWIVVDSVYTNGIKFTKWNPKIITYPTRPDLFFRKLSGMFISYRNEGESVWNTFDGFETAILNNETFWCKLTDAPQAWKALDNKNVDLRIYFR